MQSLSEHTTITLTLSKLISHFCTSNCIKGALHLTQPVTRTKKTKKNYSNTDLYKKKKKKKSIFISENHCTHRQPLNKILWNEKNCSSCNSVDGDKAISSHIQYIRNALGWLQLTREV